MHYCLRILEIQTRIIELLEDACSTSTNDPSRDKCLATLASLARTSSVFTEAALDELWRDQPSLAYLIQVMPDDLWTITKEPELPAGVRDGGARTVETLKFNRPLEDTDWSRFEYYSHRIQSLGNRYMFLRRPPEVDDTGFAYLDWHRPPDVDTSVFKSFNLHRPFDSLLPNLYAFHLNLTDPSTLRCLPFMPAVLFSSFSPLKALVLDIPHRLPDDFSSFLSSISSTCTAIHLLEVKLLNQMEPILFMPSHSIMLIPFICDLNNLQTLMIPREWTATPNLIHHLGNLTGFHSCRNIFIDSSMTRLQIRELFDTSDSGRFSELRYLHLRTSTPDQAADIVQSLQLPLVELCIEFGQLEFQPPTSVPRLIESFVNHNCISSLTSLALRLSLPFMPAPDSCNNFKPLFLLKALRIFYLEWETNLPFDDDWLADAAMAWPYLNRLILYAMENKPPVATLAGLVPLIRHCPQLSYLSLSTLDAKPFGWDQDVLFPGIGNRQITRLGMPFSLITDPEGVFQCLRLMFPCLTSIDYGPVMYQNRNQQGDWDRLVQLLKPIDESKESLNVLDGFGNRPVDDGFESLRVHLNAQGGNDEAEVLDLGSVEFTVLSFDDM
ncbi:hypothetical protein FPV67DRAFT_1776330 [Lyophyllum atratum]|nr:hypothetical protein FPV67DRAFT_1776330 [Lyophyllum atratum]